MEAGSRSPQILRVAMRLSQVEGFDQAIATVDTCLAAAGLTDVRTADQVLQFAEALIRHGGFAAVIGRSLKVEALLRSGR